MSIYAEYYTLQLFITVPDDFDQYILKIDN